MREVILIEVIMYAAYKKEVCDASLRIKYNLKYVLNK